VSPYCGINNLFVQATVARMECTQFLADASELPETVNQMVLKTRIAIGNLTCHNFTLQAYLMML
jgi:hypothetical protein